ncbi:DciA family protein [Spongiactinospora sp. 9N601]|uniref:DciA family protein n=1 Tax=Spongiactinospora sp. 9N601 TaxID=3375149 RepID=UPI00379ED775
MSVTIGPLDHSAGRHLGAHTRPERFTDGSADSTDRATQVRLPATALVRRLNEELGEGAVRRVKVQGAAARAAPDPAVPGTSGWSGGPWAAVQWVRRNGMWLFGGEI